MQAPFVILIDGQCTLCRREGRFLQRLDAQRGRLSIVDITAPDFDPAAYGTTMDEAMGQIHGVTAEGRLITGVEVFRRAYAAVGWGWLVAWTGWPLVRPLVDRFYVWFARHRIKISHAVGRLLGDPHPAACENGRCAVPQRPARP